MRDLYDEGDNDENLDDSSNETDNTKRVSTERGVDDSEAALRKVCANHKAFSQARQLDLVKRAQGGDSIAMDLLIEHNSRLVAKVVASFVAKIDLCRLGCAEVDLAQEGNLGLIMAIKGFNDRGNISFSTHAFHLIRRSILTYLAKSARLIRLPAHVQTELRKINSSINQLSASLEREPTIHEIAVNSGLTDDKVRERMELNQTHIVSLTESTFSENDVSTGRGCSDLSDELGKPTEQLAQEHEGAVLINRMFHILAPIEARILRLRYGLASELSDQLTHRQIGEILKISKQRVSQIEIHALEKLRKTLPESRTNFFD